MAKRKRKRKSSAKSSAKSQTRRSRAPFVGDQVLALYHLFGSCCCLGALSLIASLGLGVTAVTTNKQEAIKHIKDKQAVDFLNNLTPQQGIIIFYIRGIWLGRKWALFVSLLTSAPSAAFAIYANQSDGRIGSVVPVVVAIYCVLRLLGSVGPKV